MLHNGWRRNSRSAYVGGCAGTQQSVDICFGFRDRGEYFSGTKNYTWPPPCLKQHQCMNSLTLNIIRYHVLWCPKVTYLHSAWIVPVVYWYCMFVWQRNICILQGSISVGVGLYLCSSQTSSTPCIRLSTTPVDRGTFILKWNVSFAVYCKISHSPPQASQRRSLAETFPEMPL